MSADFIKILDNFNNITDKLKKSKSVECNHANQIKLFLKHIYDLTKSEEENSIRDALPELIIDNFDLEQIFEEVELQNKFLDQSLKNVSKFLVSKNRLIFTEVKENLPSDKSNDDEKKDSEKESDMEVDDESENEQGEEEENIHSSNDDELLSSEDDNENNKDSVVKFYKKKSIVDDEFFKLEEMEDFLKAEENALNKTPKDDSGNDSDLKEDEDDIDFFKRDSSESEDEENLRKKNPKYKDFFRPNEETANEENKFNDQEEENELPDTENDYQEPKSTFELREERLKNKIKILENVALNKKPWQLQGEITAENRPQNSLLEEVVEFDLTSRPAPVITEKTTFHLEDLVRQRLKDRAYDSVDRKQRPTDTPFEFKTKLILNQEKSKESLAQIYENEYLQQREALTGNAEEKEEEEPELHKDINKMMKNLFRQLDALSNFHFTPKPAAPELKIISNLPAINMEEVAPVAASDAALLAPEEVKNRIKGDIIGKSERTDADKNRERRKKKRKQGIHSKDKKKKENIVNKTNLGLGNKYTKEKIKRELERITKEKNVDKMDESGGSKSLKSSTAFFKQLEEEVKTQIKAKTLSKKQKINNGFNAKKLKL